MPEIVKFVKVACIYRHVPSAKRNRLLTCMFAGAFSGFLFPSDINELPLFLARFVYVCAVKNRDNCFHSNFDLCQIICCMIYVYCKSKIELAF